MPTVSTPRYITVGELQTLLWVSGQEELLKQIILSSEALFDTLVESPTGLIKSAKTEYHPSNDYSLPIWKIWRVFQLQTYNPVSITTINGVSPGVLNTDYTLKGQELEFAEPIDQPTTFPYRYTIVYESGFASTDIPQDIKTAIRYIANGFYHKQKSEWIASFRQDLLSVNYNKENIVDIVWDRGKANFVTSIVNKYTIFNVLTT